METVVGEECCFENHESQCSVCLQSKFAQTVRERVWRLRDRSEDAAILQRFTPPRLPLLPNAGQAPGAIGSTTDPQHRAPASSSEYNDPLTTDFTDYKHGLDP